MAKLLRAVTWRRLERPYTRKSKYRKKNFVRSVPNSKIVKYNMGDLKQEFTHTLLLRSKQDLQVRHNALESARQSSNRYLEKKLGRINFRLLIRVYPHHILRNNPLAAGAGADRMSTGMARSFGKVVGLAARVKEGQPLFEVCVNKQHVKEAKAALVRAKNKLPCSCSIEVIEPEKAK
ncbi:50S ribosomal protein L16 [Candidatus Woesearchaeota archaeon]|nr:50S ribosomal protein L16 [Candidatus Woesearchaeota archaeon]